MVNLLLAIIYLAFISLGLPDSLLGSAWPAMYPEFNVPVSYAGIISMIISLGTIVSSLMSDRLTRTLGTGKIMVCSVGMTAAALLGFSFCHSYWILLLWAIPYGLGAGSVDAALNNYVALHYESRHMNWLHCMWGVGAAAGPYIMSFALTSGHGWNLGYRYIAILQIILTAVLFISLPLWRNQKIDISSELTAQSSPAVQAEKVSTSAEGRTLSLREILQIPGAKEIMLCFFCYSALEVTSGLWASSYLALHSGISADMAAGYASLFYIGITAGRAVSGFITMKLDDEKMIRLGEIIMAAGIAALLVPGPLILALAGFILLGLGCAPVYPCIIHSTPAHFGADRSQAMIGVQMASAYAGSCLMPPLFGLLASNISVSLLPFYMLLILAIMVLMHELLVFRTAKKN